MTTVTKFDELPVGARFRMREPKRGRILFKVDATGARPAGPLTGNVAPAMWAGGHVAIIYPAMRVYPVRA